MGMPEYHPVDCIRFAVYIPRYFVTLDPENGQEITQYVPEVLIAKFLSETVRVCGGVTQANPYAAAPYRGLWRGKGGVETDFNTFAFGICKLKEAEVVRKHFAHWKGAFQRQLRQDIIMVVYWPVFSMGDV